MPRCHVCERTLAKVEFSSAQLKKPAVSRRCRACAGSPTGSGKADTTDAPKPAKKHGHSRRQCSNGACRKTGAALSCARCKGPVYCSRECQRLHWRKDGGNHTAYCSPAPRAGQPLPPRPTPQWLPGDDTDSVSLPPTLATDGGYCRHAAVMLTSTAAADSANL